MLGWRLLLIVQEKTNDWPGVEVSCKKIINILKAESKVSLPDSEDAESYSIKMHLMQAKALFYMGHMNHLKQAVTILDEVRVKDAFYEFLFIWLYFKNIYSKGIY